MATAYCGRKNTTAYCGSKNTNLFRGQEVPFATCEIWQGVPAICQECFAGCYDGCGGKIQKELQAAERGCILHDRWTKYGKHYVGLFACYCLNGQTFFCLLGCSCLMQSVDDENEDEIDVPANQTAAAHVEYIQFLLEHV